MRIEPLEDRSMLSGATDIVFLFDESQSTGSIQQDWLSSAVVNVDASLAAAGVTNRRYGLVGFGDASNEFAHTHLVDPTDTNQDGEKFFGSAAQLATATSKLKADGLHEDGWDAIEHTVAEYNFNPGAAVMFVLIQNTDGRWRDNLVSWTREGILETLKSQNVTLCSIVEASFDPDMYGTGGLTRHAAPPALNATNSAPNRLPTPIALNHLSMIAVTMMGRLATIGHHAVVGGACTARSLVTARPNKHYKPLG